MKKTATLFLAVLFTLALHAQGTWTQKNNFSGSGRYAAFSFEANGTAFIGCGQVTSGYDSTMWKYNPGNDTWTQVAAFPGGTRYAATACGVGTKAYVGCGFNGTYHNDWWEYDAVANTWTSKANFTGTACQGAVAVNINGKVYVHGGTTGSSSSNYQTSTHVYDPATNVWTTKASLPGLARLAPAAFALGDKMFIVGGAYTATNMSNETWQYDPSNNSWTMKANFGGGVRGFLAGFQTNAIGFAGCGTSDGTTNTADLWRYDPVGDAWTALATFSGSPRRAFVSFAINNRGYIATGYSNASFYANDVWEYTPIDVSVPEINTGKDLTTFSYNAGLQSLLIGTHLSGTAKLKVYDLSGKCCFSATPELSGTAQWQNIPVLSTGVYVVSLECEGKAASGKIFVR